MTAGPQTYSDFARDASTRAALVLEQGPIGHEADAVVPANAQGIIITVPNEPLLMRYNRLNILQHVGQTTNATPTIINAATPTVLAQPSIVPVGATYYVLGMEYSFFPTGAITSNDYIRINAVLTGLNDYHSRYLEADSRTGYWEINGAIKVVAGNYLQILAYLTNGGAAYCTVYYISI